MKISINSTYSYIRTNINYGSTLQCYALQKYLKKRGHDPEHLRDYRANPVLILKRLKTLNGLSLSVPRQLHSLKWDDLLRTILLYPRRVIFRKRQCIKIVRRQTALLRGVIKSGEIQREVDS